MRHTHHAAPSSHPHHLRGARPAERGRLWPRPTAVVDFSQADRPRQHNKQLLLNGLGAVIGLLVKRAKGGRQ